LNVANFLTQQLVIDVPFDFNKECLSALLMSKETLVLAPMIQTSGWELPFEVMCNANDHALEVGLGQRKDRKSYTIYYAS